MPNAIERSAYRWALCVLLAIPMLSAVAASPQASEPLPRRAALGAQLANENGAVRVLQVLPGGTAEALGVQPGDVLLAMNDTPVATIAEVLAWLGNGRAGMPIALRLRRGDSEMALRGIASERGRDPGSEDYRVEYGQVEIGGAGDRARLRTLTSIPAAPAPNGKYPVLFYVQGVALGTVDTVLADGNAYSRFLQPFARAGYITYRVEKPGVGDSEGGPGTAVDFERELDGYRAGLKALIARGDVDPERVFVFGHSMGGVWGPLLASEFRVRGLAVYGTAYRGWYDYELENARRQYALAGMQGAQLDAAMAQKTLVADRFLKRRLAPEQILAQHPELRGAVDEMFQGGVYFGRALPFWHQLNAIDMPAMWARAGGAVLAMHGAGDYVSSGDDHRAIVERVNALRPGTARFVEVPADHGFMGFESERAAFAGFGKPGGMFSESVIAALDAWLAPMSGIRAMPAGDVSARRLPAGVGMGRTMDVSQGDADGDGDLDLFLAKEFAPNELLRNDGGRYVRVAGALPAADEDSEDAVLGDFDGDGDLDAVFPSEDTANNEYYLNDGRGAFAASPDPLPTKTNSNAGVAGDIDGDGDLDLILSRNAASELVLLNDGRGRFSDASARWMPEVIDVTQDLKLADIDGDDDLDLIAGNEPADNARNRIYINTGKAFVDETAARFADAPAREETRKVAVADIDGDGDADLLFANVEFRQPQAARSRLLINDGRGVFRDGTAARLPALEQSVLDAAFEDVDRDGDADLLFGTIGAGAQLLRNDGRGRFAQVDGFAAIDPQRVGIAIALLRTSDGLYLYESGFDRGDRVLEVGG